jgi:hypothetical protein
MALVLTTAGTAPQSVEVRVGAQAVDVQMPADSVTTLSWA